MNRKTFNTILKARGAHYKCYLWSLADYSTYAHVITEGDMWYRHVLSRSKLTDADRQALVEEMLRGILSEGDD